MINCYEKLESIRTDKSFFDNLPKKQKYLTLQKKFLKIHSN